MIAIPDREKVQTSLLSQKYFSRTFIDEFALFNLRLFANFYLMLQKLVICYNNERSICLGFYEFCKDYFCNYLFSLPINAFK